MQLQSKRVIALPHVVRLLMPLSMCIAACYTHRHLVLRNFRVLAAKIMIKKNERRGLCRTKADDIRFGRQRRGSLASWEIYITYARASRWFSRDLHNKFSRWFARFFTVPKDNWPRWCGGTLLPAPLCRCCRHGSSWVSCVRTESSGASTVDYVKRAVARCNCYGRPLCCKQ